VGDHYGLKIGDRVREYFGGDFQIEGTVTYLYKLDNNKARIMLDNGTEENVVCEWCKKVQKAEA
jgi:hypothetical protein